MSTELFFTEAIPFDKPVSFAIDLVPGLLLGATLNRTCHTPWNRCHTLSLCIGLLVLTFTVYGE